MAIIKFSTIGSPEFLNISSISPLVSKCEIKVLYTGLNRNGSFISRNVAEKMAQTLPCSPIVGYYIENKEDFGDHGDQMIIDGEGVHFKSLTKPYGFVAPDSKIWFQNFEEIDEYGNVETREYLMTEGFLWTGQFEECSKALNESRPQSMELDSKTLKGFWSEDSNRGIDFFIINDATFSKLCILGEDVEPCFEGANIKEVSQYTKGEGTFVKDLFSMMEELKYTLNSKKGESERMEEKMNVEVEFSETQDKFEQVQETEIQNNVDIEFAEKKDDKKEEDEENKENSPAEDKESDSEEDKKEKDKEEYACGGSENDNEKKKPKEEYACGNSEEDKKKKDEYACAEEEEEEKKPEAKHSLHTDEEYSDLENKFNLLQTEHSELKDKFALLESEVAELREFKLNCDNEEKDAMIASFSMLSDEDKKEVIENKAKYSIDDIEAKLSVICVRKKVIFDNNKQFTDSMPVTYNLNSHSVNSKPSWLQAVDSIKENNK